MTTNAASKLQAAPTLTREQLLAALPSWRWYWGDQVKRWAAKTPGTPAELWAASENGAHLLWLAAWAGVDRRQLVAAACAVARTVLKHVPASEKRPLQAIETAERWARREPGVTLLDVRTADADAADADADAADADAAAAAAAADADADAADAAADAAAAYRSTRTASLKASADLVRSHIPWSAVEAALLQ